MSLLVFEIYIFEVYCSGDQNFSFDNFRTILNCFAFVLIISRPNQNVLLSSNNKMNKFKHFALIYKFFD